MSTLNHPTRRVAEYSGRRLTLATLLLAVVTMLGVSFASFSASAADAASTGIQSWTPLTLQTEASAEAGTVKSIADIAEESNPFVVTVYTFVESQSAGPSGLRGNQPVQGDNAAGAAGDPVALGAGSGWIYSADGYVITNAHVVSGADTFVVRYSDGTEVAADLVGADTMQDVAVLKLQLDAGDSVPGVAPVGDSAAMRAGEEVIAIGSPLGEFTNSVSDGIIGGLDRSLDAGEGLSLDNLIQHDAEISSGNSGGPLLNMNGEVIGMNVAKIDTASTNGSASVSGLNFAIDGNTVVERAQEIIDQNGSIAYPFVGVQTQQAEDGLVIVDVLVDGPAAMSGLQAGDILTGIDGEAIDADSSFTQLLMQHRPGDTVSVTVERGGESLSFEVTLGERPVEAQA